jgi:phage shock protein PspC (stress-responsive transcriptional regulator)
MAAKKLRLSSTDKVLAGVCGGLAEYLDVDVNVVRIIVLVSAVCGSFGLWAYLITWLILSTSN